MKTKELFEGVFKKDLDPQAPFLILSDKQLSLHDPSNRLQVAKQGLWTWGDEAQLRVEMLYWKESDEVKVYIRSIETQVFVPSSLTPKTQEAKYWISKGIDWKSLLWEIWSLQKKRSKDTEISKQLTLQNTLSTSNYRASNDIFSALLLKISS